MQVGDGVTQGHIESAGETRSGRQEGFQEKGSGRI